MKLNQHTERKTYYFVDGCGHSHYTMSRGLARCWDGEAKVWHYGLDGRVRPTTASEMEALQALKPHRGPGKPKTPRGVDGTRVTVRLSLDEHAELAAEGKRLGITEAEVLRQSYFQKKFR